MQFSFVLTGSAVHGVDMLGESPGPDIFRLVLAKKVERHYDGLA